MFSVAAGSSVVGFMLPVLLTLAWIVAIACMVYLAAHAIRNRWYARRRRKAHNKVVRKFKRHHHFDQKRQHWIRNVDGEVVVVDEDAEDRRLFLTFVGWILLIAWEVYWILEIIERFKTTKTPLQLPYFFLLVIMVVIPGSIYLYFRRRLRRSAASL